MSFWSSLVAWGNVPFTVTLAVTVLFALLQVSGLLGLLAGGAEHDVDAHAAGHDGGDADGGDADADDSDADDGDADDAQTSGKLPSSLLWMVSATAFALAGLAMNAAFLAQTGAVPAYTLVWTLPGAFVVAFLTRGLTQRVLGRFLVAPGQEATRRSDLVGKLGVVISSRVDGEFGEVRLNDKTGHVVRVICRTYEGEIGEGREVVVVECDEVHGHLFVAALDAEAR